VAVERPSARVARGACATYAPQVSVAVLVDPGERAERRAQRLIAARDRRRALLLTARPAMRGLAFALVVAGACAALYGWARPISPLLLFACAAALTSAARLTGRMTPPALSSTARAHATVREAWRVLRPDADEARSYPRHAVWACEAGDGTVGLWRLTRAPGEALAADGRYAVTATLLCSLGALDTAAAAEATAEARAAADRDEQDAMAEQVGAYAAAAERALRAERDIAELDALRTEARGLARALRG
jgi:hypothetical protein